VTTCIRISQTRKPSIKGVSWTCQTKRAPFCAGLSGHSPRAGRGLSASAHIPPHWRRCQQAPSISGGYTEYLPLGSGLGGLPHSRRCPAEDPPRCPQRGSHSPGSRDSSPRTGSPADSPQGGSRSPGSPPPRGSPAHKG